MSTTKLLSILLIALSLILIGCQPNSQNGNDTSENQTETRESVIERYSGGEKKVVAVYEGEGTEEKLLRRITYAKNGERIKIEDKQSGEVKRFEDLHPEYSNPDSLKKFLTRSAWGNVSSIGEDKMSGVDIYEDDKLYKFIKLGDIARKITYSIDYIEGFKVRRVSNGDVDTSRIYLFGPNQIAYNEEGEGIHHRTEISDIESMTLKKAVKELEVD